MTIIPFACLAIGITIGIIAKNPKVPVISDKISTGALLLLMMSIGLGIGLDKSIIANLWKIGFNCGVIALCAIGFSVVFTFLCEKTVLPLKKVDQELAKKNLDIFNEEAETTEEKKTTSLVWLMPAGLIVGLLVGVLGQGKIDGAVVDKGFIIFLMTLYICVGVSQGANKEVFSYIKVLGLKILWLPIGILVGSLVGGLVAGLILGLPMEVSLISAGGMSFYSITGAFMTSAYGLEVGAYGFIVNVMREFFTILLMPLLIKISQGSPIAGGAAGNMDTMLAPVTKFVGVRLGLVTLITGTILTFVVPFLLPLLATIVG